MSLLRPLVALPIRVILVIDAHSRLNAQRAMLALNRRRVQEDKALAAMSESLRKSEAVSEGSAL